MNEVDSEMESPDTPKPEADESTGTEAVADEPTETPADDEMSPEAGNEAAPEEGDEAASEAGDEAAPEAGNEAASEAGDETASEPDEEAAPDDDTIPIKGLIFDLDGTLIDSANDIAASTNAVLEEMELPVKPIEEVAQHIGDGVRVLLSRILETEDEEILDTAMGTFFEHYSEHYLDSTTAHVGAKEILEHFKDKQCAVVSNKPEIFCRAILAGLGLDNNLVAIIGGDTAETRKPDPQPFHEALDLMGIEASEIIVIGDGIHDIAGGRAAGARTCAVTYGLTDAETLAATNPDFTIDELPALAQLFS